MRHLARTLSFVLVTCLGAASAAAQGAPPNLVLPQPSPRAKVEQRVGITDFALEYSSPAVKGRKIWGELVPMDKAWRAGANASTMLTASRDFKLGTTAVKAGSYSVFMIPNDKQWTVILNSDVNAGANHDPKKDIARVTVAPEKMAQPRERLTYLFSDTTDDTTKLDLEWETIRVRVPLAVDTRTQVAAAIEGAVGDTWRPYFMSANYYFSTGDTKRALPLVKQSIALKPTARNEWLHAQILAKDGKKADARAAANRALKLGQGDKIFEQFFKPEINKQVATWK